MRARPGRGGSGRPLEGRTGLVWRLRRTLTFARGRALGRVERGYRDGRPLSPDFEIDLGGEGPHGPVEEQEIHAVDVAARGTHECGEVVVSDTGRSAIRPQGVVIEGRSPVA